MGIFVTEHAGTQLQKFSLRRTQARTAFWYHFFLGISLTNTPLSNGILRHSMRSKTYIFIKTAMVTDVSIKVLKEFKLYSSD
jgi:hypothetical protein